MVPGIRSLLRQPGRVARFLWRAGPAGDPLRVAGRWWRRPAALADREVCLFMTFDPSGTVPEHALHHARAWAGQGYAVVVIVATDDVSRAPGQALDFADGVLLRRNVGYDFGAWASAIRSLPDLKRATRVAIVNDSVYGPLDGFAAMLARVRASRADYVGVIESREITPHVQSCLVFFNRGALRSGAFRRFWRSVRIGNREEVIRRYELRLSQRLGAAGLTREVLFPSPDGVVTNPTLTRWRALIDQGFPFVKRQLLRDNPRAADIAGWQDTLAAHGFNPAIAERHLDRTRGA